MKPQLPRLPGRPPGLSTQSAWSTATYLTSPGPTIMRFPGAAANGGIQRTPLRRFLGRRVKRPSCETRKLSTSGSNSDNQRTLAFDGHEFGRLIAVLILDG